VGGVVYMIYNIYLHPLSAYPGPNLFIATRIPWALSFVGGSLPRDVKHFHDVYGDVVRIGPNDLSFINADAWKDIYGHRPGRPELEKDKKFYLNGGIAPPGDILTANEADHSRFRRLLSRSFSEKALRDQEPLIRKYVDLLISRLHRRIQDNRPIVDLVSWYNWATFDLIGDLAFGEPFNCLCDESYHFWVRNVFQNVKANSLFNAAKDYPGVLSLVQLLMPRSLKEARDNHVKLTVERVEARMALETDRPDFLSPILNNHDDKAGMTKPELMGIANLLIIAGSETTATLLSGVTYYLLRNSEVMQRLIKEVRGAFTSEDQINLISVQKLDYMLAVLDEALRIYLPSPTGLPRVVGRGGDYICGKWVPEGVCCLRDCTLTTFCIQGEIANMT
jgi:cytochrome P450